MPRSSGPVKRTNRYLRLLISGCATSTYNGKGGMTAHRIKPEVYSHHYEKGFTGPDAMGWNPNLQYAWSRMGAAKTCGVAVNQELVVKKLIAVFEQDPLTHNTIGIDFHHMQSKAIPSFCTPSRIAELKALVPRFEAGEFPKPF